MENTYVDDAVELLEKANADLDPDLISIPEAKRRLQSYARAQRLGAFGVAALARKIDDAERLARVTGTSIGKAKEMVATSKVLDGSAPLNEALRHGEVSLDQATEIARAEGAAPGSAKELLKVAKKESFHVLKDEARRAKLEAEQHQGLAARQRAARSARHYSDALGMVNIHLALEPHVGAPIMARAEAEAERVARAAKKSGGDKEPFERYLADGYAKLLSGAGKGRATRPELVILVSHEVAKRGWKDVKEGEMCKIPGLGPVAPEVAKDRTRCVPHRRLLRRQRPPQHQALRQAEGERGGGRARVGTAARLPRGQVRRLWQTFQDRVRSLRAGSRQRSLRALQPRPAMLVMSPSQDGTRPEGGQPQTAGSLTVRATQQHHCDDRREQHPARTNQDVHEPGIRATRGITLSHTINAGAKKRPRERSPRHDHRDEEPPTRVLQAKTLGEPA